jgi:hypothetical protein
MTLQSGRIPIGWNGDALQAVNAKLTAAGQVLSIVQARAEHRTGKYTGRAELNLEKYGDPILQGEARSEHAVFPLYESLAPLRLGSGGLQARAPLWAEAEVALRAAGPVTSALVQGEVRLHRLNLGEAPAISFLWERGSKMTSVPAPFTVAVAPFRHWRLEVAAALPEPAPVVPGQGSALPKLQIRGTGRLPELTGTIDLRDIPAQAGSLPVTVKNVTLTFAEGRPQDPMIDLHATGVIQHFPFNAYVIGPLSLHMSFADSEEALARFAIRADTLPLEQPSAVPGAPNLLWPRMFKEQSVSQ